MKITGVKAYALKVKVDHPFNWRKGLSRYDKGIEKTVMRIITDEGFEGVVTIPRGAIAVDLIERRIKDMLIGRDPMLKEKIWEEMWELDRVEEFPIYMLGSVDVALWDITAKAAKLPLYKIIGGYTDKVQAYASTVTYDSIDQYLRIADACLERGYKAIKLHAWGNIKQDAKLAKALRKHVGDDVELMYDGSAGFDLIDAIWLGKRLEEANFRWYEEPMREFSINHYKKLCDALDIPVLSAETSDGCHFNAADFIHYGAADLIRVSAVYKGGITGALRVAHLADSFGMRAEIHGNGMANLHLACAIPNNSFFEIIVLSEPAIFWDEVDSDGFMTPPDVPGTGELHDWEQLEKEAFLKT